MIQTIFHIQVHTALASGHIQENTSAASKTTILFLKAQAIENKTEYKLKQNMKWNKKKKEEENNYWNQWNLQNKTT